MRKQLTLSLLTAVLITFSMPPFRTGFLAYGALVPFLLLLDPLSMRGALRWGYITGFIISLGTIHWIWLPTPPGAVAAILVHSAYFMLFAAGYVFLKKRLGAAAVYFVPFLWTAMEYFKSLGELGFPWVSLGYTQTYYPSLIQYASFTSVYGVSFWVAVLNVCVYQLFQYRHVMRSVLAYAAAMVLLLLIPFLHGRMVIPDGGDTQPAETIRVAVVQGNIDPYIKWDPQLRELSFQTYEKLTRAVGRKTVDLIIWPETATPTYLLHNRQSLTRVLQLYRELETPILTGTPDYIRLGPNRYKTFNSVVLLDDSPGRYQTYSKMRLVPFGERVPYEDKLAFLKALLEKLEMGEGNFSPGEKQTVFQLSLDRATNGKQLAFATVICFESIFPELVAEFVRRGARLMVVVTNDGWFKKTVAPYQHAQMAVFRAIENRVAIARSANTGISMTIDPYGRVRKQTALWQEAVIVDELPLRRELTFFTRYGHAFANGVLLLTVGVLLIVFIENKVRKE